jgi:hypothetical protein
MLSRAHQTCLVVHRTELLESPADGLGGLAHQTNAMVCQSTILESLA